MRFVSALSLSLAVKRLLIGAGAATGAEIGLLLITGGISGAGSLTGFAPPDPLLPPKPSLP